jgi:hypothetical protein
VIFVVVVNSVLSDSGGVGWGFGYCLLGDCVCSFLGGCVVLDIGVRMRELIPVLRVGVNGVSLPDVAAECESEWGVDYAIVMNVYHCCDDHYFDEDLFYCDLSGLLLRHFSVGGESVVLCSDNRGTYPSGTVVVFFDRFRSAREVEVFRVR